MTKIQEIAVIYGSIILYQNMLEDNDLIELDENNNIKKKKKKVNLVESMILEDFFKMLRALQSVTPKEARIAELEWMLAMEILEDVKEEKDWKVWSSIPLGLSLMYYYADYKKRNKLIQYGVKRVEKIRTLLGYKQLQKHILNSYNMGEFTFKNIIDSKVEQIDKDTIKECAICVFMDKFKDKKNMLNNDSYVEKTIELAYLICKSSKSKKEYFKNLFKNWKRSNK